MSRELAGRVPSPSEAATILADLARGLAAAGALEDAVELGLAAVLRLAPGDGAAAAERLEEPAGSLLVLGARGPEARLQPPGAVLGAGSLQAAVLRGGEPRVSGNLDAEPEAASNPLRSRVMRAGVIVPMHLGGAVSGTLTVSAAEVPWAAPSAELLALISAVADQVGAAVGALRTRGQLLKRLDQIDAMGRVAHALTGVGDARGTMEYVAEEGREVFLAQRAGVFLFDWAGERADCMVALDLPSAFVRDFEEGLLRSSLARPLARRHPVVVEDARTLPPDLRDALGASAIRSCVVLPLIFGGETIGAIGFFHDRAQAYPADERRLMTAFADQAALAIGKSRLIELIERSKREWQSAFDATSGGLALLDADGAIVRANLAVARLAGCAVTELPGRRLAEAVRGWPRGERDPLVAAAQGRSSSSLMDADGGRLLVATATPRLEGGFVVALDDVTEVMRLEDRFRLVVETAYDAIVIVDASGRVSFANPAAAELFDRPVDELGGRPLSGFLPDPGSPPMGAPLAQRARRFETVVTGPRGESRWVAVSSSPLGSPGQPAGSVVILRDVTSERTAAEERRRSEARYRTLFAVAPLAIFTLDAEGSIRSANRAALSLVGLTQPRVGEQIQRFLTAGDGERTLREVAATLAGDGRAFELRFTRVDGVPREAALVTVPFEEPGGGRTALAIARDVTDERALRDRLVHSEKLAALGHLVAGVAHELNNPLAGILALAQTLMLEEPLDPGTARVLSAIREEAARAGRTVNDLLTFGRQRPLERRVTDLNAIVREAFSVRPDRGAAWALDLAEGLPSLSADPDQLRQVVDNLVGNAEAAMAGRDGPCRIRTWAEGAGVFLEVVDRGPGIAPEVLPRIFEPFFTTKGAGGSGLGLSISHGIVRAHGGEIRAANQPGGGARVWFELPRTPGPVRRA